MKISPQSEQFGLPEKEARELPSASEMSELLKGAGITSGLMSRHVTSEGVFYD
jgi:hypothetical protein